MIADFLSALLFTTPSLLMSVLTPAIFVVNKLSQGVLLLLRIDPDKKESLITEHELRTIVNVSHEEGVIESEERQMINNVFDFGDSQAREIMVPRIDVAFADVKSANYDVSSQRRVWVNQFKSRFF